MTIHLTLPPNEGGRDFVVGDIHGHFEVLCRLMDDVMFDGVVDRLISVGDLIDRGPFSAMVPAWLELPWFYSVKGNHEDAFVHDFHEGTFLRRAFNGNAWRTKLSDENILQLVDIFESLPTAITLQTPHGDIGIVHADVPSRFETWVEFVQALEAGDRRAVYEAQRSRGRISGKDQPSRPVEGIDVVIVGHKILPEITLLNNVLHIDTGAYYPGGADGPTGRLTLLQVAGPLSPNQHPLPEGIFPYMGHTYLKAKFGAATHEDLLGY